MRSREVVEMVVIVEGEFSMPWSVQEENTKRLKGGWGEVGMKEVGGGF